MQYVLKIIKADWRSHIATGIIFVDERGNESGIHNRESAILLIERLPANTVFDQRGRALCTAGSALHHEARNGYVQDPSARYIKVAPCPPIIGNDQWFDDPVVDASHQESPFLG